MAKGVYDRKKKTESTVAPPVAPQADPVAELSKKFDQLVDIVSDLASKVSAKNEPEKKIKPDNAVGEARGAQIDISEKYPEAWREVVDRILGPDFRMRVEDTVHGDFRALIYVPKHLDRRSAKNDDINPDDISSCPMRRASPVPDLEGWCLKIQKTIKAVHPHYQS